MDKDKAHIPGKWNRTGEWIERISRKGLLVMCLAWAVFFAVLAGIYSNDYPADYSVELAFERSDSLLLNVLVWIAGTLVTAGICWLILRGKEEKQQKLLHGLVIFLCALLGILLFVWVHIAHYAMSGDQHSVYTSALEMMQGNYRTMEKGDYFFIYPYQLDLVFVYQFLFRLFGSSYRVIQYVNILCILLTLYFNFLLLKKITTRPVVQVCYILFAFSFIPLFLYSQYVYGDMMGLACEIIGIWAVVSWCETHRVGYGICAVLCCTLGLLVKRNFYVVLIAIGIALLYHIVRKKSWRSLVLLLLCVLIPVTSSKLIEKHYETVSGIPLSKGMPLTYVLNQSLQESNNGPGAWNHLLYAVYYDLGLDYDVFRDFHRGMLVDRVHDLLNDPPALVDFFRRKLMLQWDDHTYSSAHLTHNTEGTPRSDIEWSVYYGTIKRNTDWYMDRYLFVLYVELAVGILFLWKQKWEIYRYLPLIAIIGGILSSIVYEAMARYVLPYAILMQLFASLGMGMTLESVRDWLGRKEEKGIGGRISGGFKKLSGTIFKR